MKRFLLTSLTAIALVASLPAFAAPITYTAAGSGPGPVPVSASATFDIIGNDLFITLLNTSGPNDGKDVPGSTLSGLFWKFAGNPVLTGVSATLSAGSTILGTCDQVNCVNVTNVAGEFGYQAGALPGGADRGIASSGYLTTGLPGNIGNFNNGAAGTDLDNPISLDGINFGIVSAAAGYNPNGGLAAEPVIQGGVVFRLSGALGLTNANISNVSFQYGTSFPELNLPGSSTVPVQGDPLPEPGTVALLGLGLLGFVGSQRKSKR